MEIEKYLDHSAKVETKDIDWEAGKRVGLTENEEFILTYFSDIEGQTIIYLRDLLQTKAIEDPNNIAFFSMWNYEEFFHGHYLSRLLEVCGRTLERDRIAVVRKTSQFSEMVKALGAKILSKIFPSAFTTLFMTWGAVNELTTLNGYQRLCQITKNPVLQTLCERIVKQEARHFAWYFNSAREKLAQSRFTQKLTQWVLKHFWSPVGVGVKSKSEALRLLSVLFSSKLGGVVAEIDGKISTLPGLAGLRLMAKFVSETKTDSAGPLALVHT